eukprot:Opistho-2@53206
MLLSPLVEKRVEESEGFLSRRKQLVVEEGNDGRKDGRRGGGAVDRDNLAALQAEELMPNGADIRVRPVLAAEPRVRRESDGGIREVCIDSVLLVLGHCRKVGKASARSDHACRVRAAHTLRGCLGIEVEVSADTRVLGIARIDWRHDAGQLCCADIRDVGARVGICRSTPLAFFRVVARLEANGTVVSAGKEHGDAPDGKLLEQIVALVAVCLVDRRLDVTIGHAVHQRNRVPALQILQPLEEGLLIGVFRVVHVMPAIHRPEPRGHAGRNSHNVLNVKRRLASRVAGIVGSNDNGLGLGRHTVHLEEVIEIRRGVVLAQELFSSLRVLRTSTARAPGDAIQLLYEIRGGERRENGIVQTAADNARPVRIQCRKRADVEGDIVFQGAHRHDAHDANRIPARLISTQALRDRRVEGGDPVSARVAREQTIASTIHHRGRVRLCDGIKAFSRTHV